MWTWLKREGGPSGLKLSAIASASLSVRLLENVVKLVDSCFVRLGKLV